MNSLDELIKKYMWLIDIFGACDKIINNNQWTMPSIKILHNNCIFSIMNQNLLTIAAWYNHLFIINFLFPRATNQKKALLRLEAMPTRAISA